MAVQDIQIVHNMIRADQIKASAPTSAVSADAIFIALCAASKENQRVEQSSLSSTLPLRVPISSGEPPVVFLEALARLKGRALTVGEFMAHAGMLPADKRQRNAVGAWLRAAGCRRRKSGARAVFDI